MKNLVILCDGTWLDTASSDIASNIAHLHQMLNLNTDEGVPQLNYYDSGIGTNGKLDSIVGGYTGDGLDKNIREAYDFLVNNYEPGDRVYLFGFSRGAYTVRSLAGLINHVGLLKKDFASKINDAYELYRNRLDPDKQDEASADSYKENYSNVININFIGVFDTVDALGVPLWYDKLKKYRFHDTSLNPRIDCARHALSIDEKRYDFMPVLLGDNGITDVAERAFPGVHADIGGGYDDSHGLSDIPLRWMVKEASKHGLSFNWDYYPGFSPDPASTIHDSYQGMMTKLMGYHQRHVCNKPNGHLFTPSHSWLRSSQYPIEPDTKPKQAICPHTHLKIDQSFFQRHQSIPEYNPSNVELDSDMSDTVSESLGSSFG